MAFLALISYQLNLAVGMTYQSLLNAECGKIWAAKSRLLTDRLRTCDAWRHCRVYILFCVILDLWSLADQLEQEGNVLLEPARAVLHKFILVMLLFINLFKEKSTLPKSDGIGRTDTGNKKLRPVDLTAPKVTASKN